MSPPLPEGVYESLRTDGLEAAVEALAGLTPRWQGVEAADAPHVLARHVAESVQRRLAELKDPGERLALVNDLLARVAQPEERVAAAQQLAVLSREVAPGRRRRAAPPSRRRRAAR